MTAIGIDVGGTKVSAGVVDADGRVLSSARRASPARNVAAIEDTIAELVGELRRDHSEVTAVGVAAAAFIDSSRSTVVFAPNLAWRDVPLRDRLSSRLELPVVLENDANAAAWGEFRFGAGADVDDLLLLTVGTGVGGGIVLGGELIRGARGFAAEVGHMRIEPDGRPCGCGQRGCLEQYASGSALLEVVGRAVRRGDEGATELLAACGDAVGALTGPMVSKAASEGNPVALVALGEVGTWLGEGAATLCAVLDPCVVVVGGGVAEAGEMLLGPMRTAFAAHLTAAAYRPAIEVRAATLGNQAGLIGAADLARTR